MAEAVSKAQAAAQQKEQDAVRLAAAVEGHQAELSLPLRSI